MMDTKTKIMDCAEHLIRSRGYDAFSYADIAKEIGIRKASIHYHYAAKSDLALALITRYHSNIIAALHDHRDRDISASDKIKAYLSLYKNGLSGGDAICLCIALSAARENLTEEVTDQLSRFRQDSIEWLSSIFVQGLNDNSISSVNDAQAEAYSCLAIVEGGHIMSRNDIAHFDHATAHIRSRLH